MMQHSLCLVDGSQYGGGLVEAVIQGLHPHCVELFLLLLFVVFDNRQFGFRLFQSLVGI